MKGTIMTLLPNSFVTLFLAFFSVTLIGCKATDVSAEAASTAVSVRVADVAGGEALSNPLRFSGVVRASQGATLTFQVSGTLKERRVELGQRVKSGDVLARIY